MTDTELAAAESRWRAHGRASYDLVVRVRPPRLAPVVYHLAVREGKVERIEREDGQPVAREHVDDYSVQGLFEFLRGELRLVGVRPAAQNHPPIDLRAHFDENDGRLVRYRRTLGTARRRVLLVEVLEYQPRP